MINFCCNGSGTGCDGNSAKAGKEAKGRSKDEKGWGAAHPGEISGPGKARSKNSSKKQKEAEIKTYSVNQNKTRTKNGIPAKPGLRLKPSMLLLPGMCAATGR